jgi:hypothetical protein
MNAPEGLNAAQSAVRKLSLKERSAMTTDEAFAWTQLNIYAGGIHFPEFKRNGAERQVMKLMHKCAQVPGSAGRPRRIVKVEAERRGEI